MPSIRPVSSPRTLGRIIALLLLFGLSSPMRAAPQSDLPTPSGHVNDFAGILPDATRHSLSERLRALERETGIELAVVTTATIADGSIEEYAERLFSAWGIGQRGADNGILVLVASEQRRMRIEVGYGLEGVLPDGLAGEIIRSEFTPWFRKGDYARGIEGGVARLIAVLRAAEGKPAPAPTPGAQPTGSPAATKDWHDPLNVMIGFGSIVAIGCLGMGVNFRGRRYAVIGPFAAIAAIGLLLGFYYSATECEFMALGVIAVAALLVGYVLQSLQDAGWLSSGASSSEGRSSSGTDWISSSSDFGSSGSSSSSSASSSDDGFGGGSSGGGGASDNW